MFELGYEVWLANNVHALDVQNGAVLDNMRGDVSMLENRGVVHKFQHLLSLIATRSAVVILEWS